MRLCDLELSIAGTALERRIARLHAELAAVGLGPRPYVWLSSDWFTPDGLTGFAVPFYLAHPRLVRLEHSVMFEAEGATHDSCMKLLRHEAAHALDNAHRLSRSARFRAVFGRPSVPYGPSYRPDPASRDFVLNLDQWYSQSHPLEDFAETFAVWLRPLSRWRSDYAGWPALAKLQFVDALMAELSDSTPRLRTRSELEPLGSLCITLREYYDEKRARYRTNLPTVHDSVLERMFVASSSQKKGRSAAAFLKQSTPELRRRIAALTGQHPYVIDQVLNALLPRCRQLGLELTRSPADTALDAAIALTAATMDALSGPHASYNR